MTSTPQIYDARPLVCFAHGKESGPWGTKIRHLADIAKRFGCQVISPDYSAIVSPEERVKHLLAQQLPTYSRLILVGSSMGGYVSAVASQYLKPDGLFLLAPAVYMPMYENHAPEPLARKTEIVFGWRDEVIPVSNGIRYAEHYRVPLHVLDGDHRLNKVLPQIEKLFEAFLADILSDLHWVPEEEFSAGFVGLSTEIDEMPMRYGPTFNGLNKLAKKSVGGYFFGERLHPSSHLYKYKWHIFWRETPVEGDAFLQTDPLSTKAAQDLIASLRENRETFLVYGHQLCRDASIWNRDVVGVCAPSYDEDPDPITTNGHR